MAEGPHPFTPFNPDFRPHSRTRAPATRNRAGCLTCRRRRKRCDGTRQVCGHCTRLNLVCHWQTPQELSIPPPPPRASPATLQDQSRPSLPIPIAPSPLHFLNSDAREPSRRALLDRRLALRYYVQTFTAMLTTNLENNGFLSVLLPMGIEDKSLLDMLVAWSSSHLSLCDDAYRIKALEHRSTALQSFTQSILNSHESPEISLAGCLVFCSMSAILGDTAGWHNHLIGAAHIIRHAGASPSYRQGLRRLSDSYEGRWLLRNFAYHDILMSVTLDREPLIYGRYWTSEPKAAIDTYFGLASDPMALISSISSLNGKMRRQSERLQDPGGHGATPSQSPSSDSHDESPSSGDEEFLTRAFNIELELKSWTCPESRDPCLISLAEAYRSAALIHLYRVMRRWAPQTSTDVDREILHQVTAIVHHVGQMPLGCFPECTSLFPLFIAGGETRSKSVMQFVRERLQHIATYRHFQNAVSALSVLEELWLQYTSITGLVTSAPLDWLDILGRRTWSLALS